MSKNIIYAIGALALGAFGDPSVSFAQDYGTTSTQPSLQQEIQQDPVAEQISYLQKEWARIKYQVADKDSQVSGLEKLNEHATKVTATYPDHAEPKIWQGIILSTKAGINGGLGALGTVKKAKALFESALQQNPTALDGSAYTSLGSLYYQVPGWPIGFGDDDQAERYLKQALQINPNGIDPNFFYADFLIEEGRYNEAKTHLNRALQASDRPMRPMADAGRRQEIKAALAKINRKGKNKQSLHNN